MILKNISSSMTSISLYTIVAAFVCLAVEVTFGQQTTTQTTKCLCKNTHYPDPSFSVTCYRNSSYVWTPQDDWDGENAVIVQHSFLRCTRAGAHRIPEDYVKLGSGYYKLHTNLASWQDAVQECAREGANLAVINSEEEAKHLMDLFQRYPDIDQRQWVNGQAWVGLNDLKTEGQFVTISGEPLKDVWAVWAPGDPNNHGDGEDCVSVRRDATLNDFGCGYTVPFFCELPPRSY